MSCYNTYHSHLKLLAINNLLPTYYKAIIPKSTIHSWKDKEDKINNTIGLNSFVSEPDFMKIVEGMSKKMMFYKTCRMALKLFETFSVILNSISDKKAILRLNKEPIIDCILILQKEITLKRACNIFNLTTNQYSYFKNSMFKCTSSTLKMCRKTYNHQLLETEITVIKQYFTAKEYLYWPITSVYHQILRDRAAYFSISTCYNYLKLLEIKRTKSKHRRKNHKIGLRASTPLEMLHMDISVFRTINNAKVYLYVVCDNFSRCILNYKVSTKFDIKLVLENIQEVKQNYFIPNNSQLIVDNGIENRTHILEDFLKSNNLKKQIAQIHISESNSMVESIFRQLKYYHIYHRNFETANDFIKNIDDIINEQRNRPLKVLNGLTPIEVLQGKIPSPKSLYNEIAESRLFRIEENRKKTCIICS